MPAGGGRSSGRSRPASRTSGTSRSSRGSGRDGRRGRSRQRPEARATQGPTRLGAAADGEPAMIEIRGIVKDLPDGAQEVRAVRGVARHPGRRFRRDHGPLRLREVHLLRIIDVWTGPTRARTARAGWIPPASATMSSRRRGTASSASSSSSSTSSPMPTRGRTSSCRSSTRAGAICGSPRRTACARSASRRAPSTGRQSSRAGSSSGWRSRGRWSTIPRSSSPTSRPGTWTRRARRRSSRCSSGSTGRGRRSWS